MRNDEHEAIERLSKGDISGLETLVQIYQLRAVRTAFAIIHDRQMAEDVVADAFITVYERIKQFNPTRPFEPWFYQIVVNHAIKKSKRAKRIETLKDELHFKSLTDRPDSLGRPEEAALLKEVQAVVYAAIGALPPKQRAVVFLRYYLEFEETKIARILECPLGTVKWRLHAARTKLRHVLAKSPEIFV